MPEDSRPLARTYRELHSSLWERMVDLCLAQIANRHIRPTTREAWKRHEKVAIDMRESLEYRFSAVRFHSGLLRQYQQRSLEELRDRFLAGNPDGFDTVYAARRHQQMLFDSIIFNILALFDYVGNAIGFSFHGMDSSGAKWRWKRAVQFARDPSGEERKHGSRRYAESTVAALVSETDRAWIDRLEEYRAELIHYKTDPAEGEHSFQFAEGQSLTVAMKIKTAPAFTKWVPMPGKARGERVPILEAADWLLLETHSSALSLIDALTVELERDPAPPDGGLRVVRQKVVPPK